MRQQSAKGKARRARAVPGPLALSSLLLALCPFILTPMSLVQIVLMFVAAFFAGVVNSIAGGGMLLVFPMMIWLGVDPKIANATCTVALWPGLLGGLLGYRKEM